MTVSPCLGFVLLFVEEPVKSGEFYKNILGCEPVEQAPTFVLFMLRHGVGLGLWSRHTAQPTVLQRAGASEVAFAHDDVDGLYQQWIAQNIPMVQTPTDMDFGRTFVALDPDGHRVRVYRLREEA
jgi:catechol 2,3-dioxygenase-like lactoylglutathione lyase family enzyme